MGVCPIVIGEVLYQLTIHALCLQFWDTFVTHFSSHQFGIAIKGGNEVVVHGIQCVLDLHQD
jgi:hypothetical protein